MPVPASASNTTTLAPTVARPGAPVLAPATLPHINATSTALPSSRNQTLPAPLPAPPVPAKAAAHNVTKAKPAQLVPANRYQAAPSKTPPPPPKHAAAALKVGSRAPSAAVPVGIQRAPVPGPQIERPAMGDLTPVSAPLEAVPAPAPSTSTASGSQAVGSVASGPAAKGVAIAATTSVMAAPQLQPAASPTHEVPAPEQAPALISSFLQAAAPVPIEASAPASAASQAPVPLASMSQLEAPAPSPLQGADAAPGEAPATAFAAAPAPGPLGSAPELKAAASSPFQGAATAPEEARAPAFAAAQAPGPLVSTSELETPAQSPFQGAAEAPATAFAAALAPGPLGSVPKLDAAAPSPFQGAALVPAPAPQAAPTTAFTAAQAPIVLEMEAGVPSSYELAPVPAAQAALAAAAAPAEASAGAAFPPSENYTVSKQRQDFLQVAVAQPAETPPTPPASAPAPADGQTAATDDSPVAAPRQAIGVIQASLVPNTALSAQPTGQAKPSVQDPVPSSSSGIPPAAERAEAPAVAATGAPAALQGPKEATAAGAGEEEPARSATATLADSGELVSSAEVPLTAGALPAFLAPLPEPEEGSLVGSSPVQVPNAALRLPGSAPTAQPPSPEQLPAGNVAFLDTGVLQPEASSPDSLSLIDVSLKSAALTSQLYRAVPVSAAEIAPVAAPAEKLTPPQAPAASTAVLAGAGFEVLPAAAPLAYSPLASSQPVVYAPAVNSMRPSAYGGYSALVNINAGQPAAFPTQPTAQPGASATPNTEAPRANVDSSLAAAAPSSSQALSPGQKALAQLLSAASPQAHVAYEHSFTSGYFDVWAAPAPCDGFFSVRARAAPIAAEAPRHYYPQGAMPASRCVGPSKTLLSAQCN